VSLFVALFGRLWYLQALQTEQLQEVATQNITRTIRTQAPRGRVLDVKGRVLVDNRLSTIVTVNQEELRKALVDRGMRDSDEQEAFRNEMFTELARELSNSGQLTKLSDLLRAYNDRSFTRFENIPVARDVDEDLLVFIGERPAKFPGVQVTQEVVRSYPFGDRAAHILGYVGSITGNELQAKANRWTIPDPEDPDSARIPDPNGKPYRSNDEIGKLGIELFFEDDLRGIPGTRVIEVDALGNFVRNVDTVAPRRGSDVVLTIDIDLQAHIEDELRRTLERAREQVPEADEPPFNAQAGTAVVMNPQDGSVLAMASYPTFKPSDFTEGLSFAQKEALDDPLAHQPLLNRATSEIYPAASTFKPFTAIAAEVFEVFGWEFVEDYDVPTSDPGYWRLRSCAAGDSADLETARELGCVRRNAGDATMEGVDLRHSLTFSSDTYYYKLGEAFWISSNDEIPDDGIQQVASDFGLGATTGIQLPGEKAGLMPTAALKQQRHLDNPEAFPFGDWYSGDNAFVAIGQGDVAITPLQLVNAYSTLANGGTLHSPNIAARVEPADGSDAIEFGPRVLREVEIPETVAGPIIDGLLGVTLQPKVQLDRPSGTAYVAFNKPDEGGVAFDLYNWPVAGKTGTAEVTGKADNSMFVGFGPSGTATWGTTIQEPEYAMVALLEEAGFGSKAAAPMVARVFNAIATEQIERALTQDEVDEFYNAQSITEIVGAGQ
jgi:penicillin-binding protein 2